MSTIDNTITLSDKKSYSVKKISEKNVCNKKLLKI